MKEEIILSILKKYYSESLKGISPDKLVSQVTRGEGIQADFYIFKIDLCGSTKFIMHKHPQTYLKLAHTFLSTIDHITRYFGADGNQVEYAGDSVFAYFWSKSVNPVNVLKAAFYSKLAASNIKYLDSSLSAYKFRTRIVLHFGSLIVSKIGPWGDGNLVAIGKPLHKVGHLEKKVGIGQSRVTIEFSRQLSIKDRRMFLLPLYNERKVAIPTRTPILPSNLSQSLFENIIRSISKNSKYSLGMLSLDNYKHQKSQYKKELIGYQINWINIRKVLKTNE